MWVHEDMASKTRWGIDDQVNHDGQSHKWQAHFRDQQYFRGMSVVRIQGQS